MIVGEVSPFYVFTMGAIDMHFDNGIAKEKSPSEKGRLRFIYNPGQMGPYYQDTQNTLVHI